MHVGGRAAMSDELVRLKRAYRDSLHEAPDGLAELEARVWRPLRAALPDLERRDDLFFAGHWQDRSWIGATGHYVGTFRAPWLGIPPTGKALALRFGEFS